MSSGYLGDIMGDQENVKKHARHHAGESADRGVFSSAMSAIESNASSLEGQSVDEDHAVKAHKKYYGKKHGSSDDDDDVDSSGATSSGMGSAAAMQALKMFGGGSSGSSSESGGSQEFMGMAMGQASKLFDQQSAAGNVSSDTSKESVVQEAGEMALKYYMSSQGGATGGLMSMASKFM